MPGLALSLMWFMKWTLVCPDESDWKSGGGRGGAFLHEDAARHNATVITINRFVFKRIIIALS